MSASVGRPRKYTDNRVQIQIRLDPKLKKRLQKEARRRAVAANLLAERAIEEGLGRWEQEKLLATLD